MSLRIALILSLRVSAISPPEPAGPKKLPSGITVLHDIPVDPKAVRFAAWADRDRTIVTVGHSGEVVWWDPKTGKADRRVRLEGWKDIGHVAAVSPCGRYFVGYAFRDSGPRDSVVGIWRLDGKEKPIILYSSRTDPEGYVWVNGCSFSWDGRLVGMGDQNGGAQVIETATGKKVAECGPVAPGHHTTLLMSPDGRTATLAFKDSRLRVWDLIFDCWIRETEPLATSRGFSPVMDSRVSWTTGLLYISGSRPPWGYQLWDRYTGQLRGAVTRTEAEERLARPHYFWPDGRLIWLDEPAPPLDRIASKTYSGVTGSGLGWSIPSDRFVGPYWAADGLRLVARNKTGSVRIMQMPFFAAPDAPVWADEELAGLWNDLASDDGEVVHRAIVTLGRAPGQAVPLVKSRWTNEAPTDSKAVAALLRDVAGENDVARRRAARELSKMGEVVRPALHEAYLSDKASEEFRGRVLQIGRSLAKQSTPGKALRRARAVEVLERIDTPEATDLLKQIAKEHPWDLASRMARSLLSSPQRIHVAEESPGR